MGKSLDDLSLDDDAGPGPDQAAKAAEVQAFLDDIAWMATSGRYDWARSTLDGIYDSVRDSGRVTDGQRTAVRNIRDSALEREARPRGGSRRYEGWSR